MKFVHCVTVLQCYGDWFNKELNRKSREGGIDRTSGQREEAEDEYRCTSDTKDTRTKLDIESERKIKCYEAKHRLI